MIRFTVAAVLCVAAAGVAADPPGSLVIRPRTPAELAAPAVTPASAGRPLVPDRPGFLVIRPRGWPTPARPATGTQMTAAVTGPTAPQPPAAPASPPASPGEGRVKLETWDVLFIRGLKAGYFHTVVREYERDGQPLVYGVKRAKLTVSRFGQPSEQWTEESSLETPAGAVLTTRTTQGIGKDQALSLEGTVTGDKLAVRITGQIEAAETVPFPAGVLGVAADAGLFPAKKPKPGDTFTYKSYLAGINRVVTHTVAVKAAEPLTVYEGQPARPALRCEVTTEKVANYRHPAATVWVDAETFEQVRLDTRVPLLGGKVTVLRTTKEYATRPAARLPELNETQSIVLDKPVPDIHAKAAVTYRVGLADLPAAEAFAADDRQSAAPVAGAGGAFDLTVTARRSPLLIPNPTPAGPEYLGDSFFIDWKAAAVKQHAAAAVSGLPPTASAWQKAQAVEAWVHRSMKAAEFSQAMATCANTANTLSGDCTEYAMLAVGMCRALGVPARTALGLVYAPARDGRGTLAYHMWFEVYADGQWLMLDGTLGRGAVGPGHLKITDSAWHNEKGFAPLLPVLAVTGAEPKVTVAGVR